MKDAEEEPDEVEGEDDPSGVEASLAFRRWNEPQDQSGDVGYDREDVQEVPQIRDVLSQFHLQI